MPVEKAHLYLTTQQQIPCFRTLIFRLLFFERPWPSKLSKGHEAESVVHVFSLRVLSRFLPYHLQAA